MRIVLSFIIAAVILFSCKEKKQEAGPKVNTHHTIDSTLLTDSSWGPLLKTANYDSLVKIYGAANVTNETICGPECADSVDVTKVFAGLDKEFTVYWDEDQYQKVINMIEADHQKSPYHSETGLKVGSTLRQLVDVNVQPISFSGFGWDYGGYVRSYNKGALDKNPVNYRLDITEVTDAETSLLGDTTLTTTMPDVIKVMDKIRVWRISHSFYYPE